MHTHMIAMCEHGESYGVRLIVRISLNLKHILMKMCTYKRSGGRTSGGNDNAMPSLLCDTIRNRVGGIRMSVSSPGRNNYYYLCISCSLLFVELELANEYI